MISSSIIWFLPQSPNQLALHSCRPVKEGWEPLLVFFQFLCWLFLVNLWMDVVPLPHLLLLQALCFHIIWHFQIDPWSSSTLPEYPQKALIRSSVAYLHHPKHTLYDWWHVHKMDCFWPAWNRLKICRKMHVHKICRKSHVHKMGRFWPERNLQKNCKKSVANENSREILWSTLRDKHPATPSLPFWPPQGSSAQLLSELEVCIDWKSALYDTVYIVYTIKYTLASLERFV